MRAFLTFGSLLVVLAAVALSARHQLNAERRFLPSAAAASDPAATIPNGTPKQMMSQYQNELNKAVQADAQHTADEAASAADDAR